LHTSTVNRRLIEAGLKSQIAAVKDILTDEHRAGPSFFFHLFFFGALKKIVPYLLI